MGAVTIRVPVALFLAASMLLGLPAGAGQGEGILDRLRRMPISILADAVDEVVGRPGFMSSAIRPVYRTTRLAGRAKTDRDGVVRIPAGQVGAVIRRAEEIEETEQKMLPVLEETGSLAETIKRFLRI